MMKFNDLSIVIKSEKIAKLGKQIEKAKPIAGCVTNTTFAFQI